MRLLSFESFLLLWTDRNGSCHQTPKKRPENALLGFSLSLATLATAPFHYRQVRFTINLLPHLQFLAIPRDGRKSLNFSPVSQPRVAGSNFRQLFVASRLLSFLPPISSDIKKPGLSSAKVEKVQNLSNLSLAILRTTSLPSPALSHPKASLAASVFSSRILSSLGR